MWVCAWVCACLEWVIDILLYISPSPPPLPQGAVIAPSEEDSQTFSVNGANGEIYKLRAVDAKERQYWVSRLRREVEHCTNQSFGTPVKEVGREWGVGGGAFGEKSGE